MTYKSNKPFKTPGVTVREIRVFGKTISSKAIAVPVFIGYTQIMQLEPNSISTETEAENAVAEGENANPPDQEERELIPVRINSFGEYMSKFGGGDYAQKVGSKKQFYLFESIKLFFANGGKTCYIVSVGDYKSNKKDLKEKLEKGIEKIYEISQANLALIPDAVSLSDSDRGDLYKLLLQTCSLQNGKEVFINQFALLDAKEGLTAHKEEASLKRLGNDNHLAHGAMYHPWLKTNVVSKGDVEKSLIEGNLDFVNKQFGLKSGWDKNLKSTNSKANHIRRAKGEEWSSFIDSTIKNNSLLPPSGAVAGAFVRRDMEEGIQTAPANINLNGVLELNAVINDTNQGDFNAPEDGKAINCIRSFVNNDIKIWGARTLDANDLDYRYVNVRRTMSMLQDSIKELLEKFVFDNNNERTWLKIRASLSKFLKGMLNRGVLAGNTPSEAYEFAVGFGETMDEGDINEGIVRVVVKLALIRPIEFIEIIFEQKTMEAGGGSVEAEA